MDNSKQGLSVQSAHLSLVKCHKLFMAVFLLSRQAVTEIIGNTPSFGSGYGYVIAIYDLT